MGERKKRIGILLDYLTSEYCENLLEGISSYCKDNDVDLIIYVIGEIHSSAPATYNYQYVATTAQIKEANVDGFVIVSGTQMHTMSQREFLSYLRSYKSLPIVNISMELPEIPSIIVDCNQAFSSMIQYLVTEQQCRKFALMGVDSKSYDVKTRTRIFKEILRNNDISIKNTVFWKSNFEYERTYQILQDYYRKGKPFDFDAIVALNDNMAFSCMDFCQKQLGLKIPEDIIITGFDDLNRASFFTPSLTTVNQHIELQGKMAAETLCKLIDKKEVPLLQTVNAEAVMRQSTNRIKDEKSSGKKQLVFDKELDLRCAVTEWYTRRTQVYRAAQFYSGMHYDIDLSRVGKLLTSELIQFGFESFAIVVYENPIEQLYPFEYFNLPQKAFLIGGFDNETGFNCAEKNLDIEFNPNEGLIPEGYIRYTSDGTIVIAIYHNTIQYGYMVVKRSSYDLGVYDLIAKAIANQLASSSAYTQLVKERSVITDRFRKLDVIAHTDELTGLKNRRGFMELGQATMNFAETIGQSGLVIYCDMDGLKKINDNYGHEAGDKAIIAQGTILRNNFRSNDIVGRIGGDEFCIISPNLKEEDFKHIREKIMNDCVKWTEENKSPYVLSISMGFISYPDDNIGFNLSQLLADADSSLYVEKRRKKAEKAQEERNNKRLR